MQKIKDEDLPFTDLPDSTELQTMAKSNRIIEFAKQLRQSKQLNYKELLETAKKLKSLDKETLKYASIYFTENGPDKQSDYDDSS